MKMSELKKYRRRVRQLEAVERELRRYAVTDSVEGSKGAPSYEKTTRLVEGYPHIERVCQLMEQRQWLEGRIRAAEDYIFGVEDERICTALILYCMDERLYKAVAERRRGSDGYRSNSPVRVTWADVAEEMDEPSSAAIKMAVYRYMHIAQ
ncbi:MAG: hypothetical protein IJ723_03305 [Ruminococcus sp.]|nr:hypothetical protein [Ruminococcus sp.]